MTSYERMRNTDQRHGWLEGDSHGELKVSERVLLDLEHLRTLLDCPDVLRVSVERMIAQAKADILYLREREARRAADHANLDNLLMAARQDHDAHREQDKWEAANLD